METQIWSKTSEKFAYIFTLRGHEVFCLKVTGNILTLKRKVQGALEGLQQGQDPSKVGANSVETLDARTITKAEVSPGNSSLTLHGGGDSPKTLSYTPAENNAEAILRAVLAQSGSTFQETKEEISVVEAVVPPAVVGALGALFWWLVYDTSGKLAAGEHIAVKPGRRAGYKQMLISIAGILGPNGTLAVGVVLLLLIVGWAAMRIIKRPERTVWVPAKA